MIGPRLPQTLLALSVALATTAWAQSSESDAAGEPASADPGWQVEQVAPGVYAAMQPESRRFDDGNAAFVVGTRDVVVVDGSALPSRAADLVAKIREVTDLPVRYVVNSHWHGDHTFGNRTFDEAYGGVEIVGHPSVGDEIVSRALPQLRDEIARYDQAIAAASERLEKSVDAGGKPLDSTGRARLEARIARARATVAEKRSIEPLVPSLHVEERLTLLRGTRTIEVRHFPGHTRGDLVVYLPAEKVLIAGDLVDALPFAGHGYPEDWIEALDEILSWEIETVIPGHGPVLRGTAHVRLLRDLLATAVREVGERAESEQDLESIKRAVTLERFREPLTGGDAAAMRAFDAFVPALVERVYEEAESGLE